MVSLQDFRKAREAVRFLAGILERVAWVVSVQAEVGKTGEAFIAVVIEPPLSVMRRRVLPTKVNGLVVLPREERR